MSGGCWNYMNDSAASEILGYHIYVGYGLDSDKHEKNYKQVVRDNPLGDPEISALVYDVFFCSTPMIGQSPATQTWTPIRKTWKSSKADGSKRQGKIGSKR